jgi:hypothetical protein
VSDKKLPSWQADNFSDLNFFSWIFKNGGKTVDRSIDRVRGIFSIFLTEFVRQKKVRDLGRAVPGSCGNFQKKLKRN